VAHVEGDGAKLFANACKLGLEGIVSKRLTSPCRSGPSKAWLKTKKRAAPAYKRIGRIKEQSSKTP
jgi:bifunctional non-homologous end joining protein LigD